MQLSSDLKTELEGGRDSEIRLPMSVTWYLRSEVRGKFDDWNRIKVTTTYSSQHIIENFIETAISTDYYCIPPIYLCYLVFNSTVYSPLPDPTHATPGIIIAELQLSTKYFQNLIAI
jgi:hypothetical protein